MYVCVKKSDPDQLVSTGILIRSLSDKKRWEPHLKLKVNMKGITVDN